MYIREEDKNPELYTETYDKWEDWMVGEVVYYCDEEWGVVTRVHDEKREYLWAKWCEDGWEELNIFIGIVKFKKRHTNKDSKHSKVEVLAVKTVSIPTEIEFEGRVYVLKENV